MAEETFEQRAAWASRALALIGNSDPTLLAHALLETLQQMAEAGMDAAERCANPAVAVLTAQLAECAGLHFHWPIAHEERCRQEVARHRAESACLTPGQPAAA